MSSLISGVPFVWRGTVDNATGMKVPLPQTTSGLKIRTADFPCRVYFTLADYTADQNYVLVPVATAATPNGEWSGPVRMTTPAQGTLYFRGDGGTATVELMAFLSRN